MGNPARLAAAVAAAVPARLELQAQQQIIITVRPPSSSTMPPWVPGVKLKAAKAQHQALREQEIAMDAKDMEIEVACQELEESEWLRVVLHKWFDDEYIPEPRNVGN